MLAVQLVLLVAMLIFTVIVRWTLKNEDNKKEHVRQVVFMASQEAVSSELDDFTEYKSSFDGYNNKQRPVVAPPPTPPPYECAVCCSFTSTRCSRCKAVRYCSSKCQIMHWRQGHKYECHPSAINVSDGDYLNGGVETYEQCETNAFDSTGGVQKSNRGTIGQAHFNTSNSHDTMPRLSTVTNDPVDLTIRSSQPGEHESPDLDNGDSTMGRRKDDSNFVDVTASSGLISPDFVHSTKKLNREQSMVTDRRKSRASRVESFSGKKNTNSSEVTLLGDVHNCESKEALDNDLLQSEGHEFSQSSKRIVAKSVPRTDSANSALQQRSRSSSSRLPHLGLKSSLQKVVHSFKATQHKKPPHHNSLHETSEIHSNKAILQYDTFLKLYTSNEVELKPFGLINCGNSCYANAVLQCLAYTRPLTLYLLQGLHSKECWKEEWCFICEFEHLIQKAREGYTPLSPIRILSNIIHLGHGREEDAHEFLRYAIDTMQSVCVQLARSVGQMVEDTTLISMTFGGYLHSKIKCMKCHNKSEMYERMMDLTVEIDGNIRSLEQALRRFTAYEMLEGNNKYHCSRCKSYEKAKKKLSVLQAPNILTIVLKRFQAGTLTKLNKLVQFPQNLDMAPFMSRSSDGYPRYNLYAVVVHLDVKSAAFCGHYVCYVKNYNGEWFKIDDSVVIRVDLESVLAEEAYILLYARQSPRPTVPSKDVSASKHPNAYLHAVPTRLSGKSGIPKATHTTSCDTAATQHQSSRKGYAKDSPYLEEWVTHSVESIPRVNSSSEASSLFSFSEEGTCSTPTTKESASVEDYTDYIFSSAG
ncbi:hypothetical protein RND81_11G237300 [Saponaria officinalis]|uniref:ubiquitinyl hydrolase 1 n=1 Tax=Saponaria officinalis TaxID=3572 RepID=A0AAW1HRE1_SAPOF